MPEIEFINTPTIPRIPTIKIDKQTSIPLVPHVTRQLPPVFDMPCTTIRTDGTKNNQLFINDEKNNVTICPMPFYEPLNYNAKDIVPIEEQKPPTPSPPPTPPEAETPKTPELPKDEKVECPDPKKNNPRIGDLNAKGTEKVSGFTWVEETKECVIQWIPTTKVEKYLPSINTVSSTFAITIVATTAATLTPLLNRVLRPLFKQIIGRIKKLFGKKGTKFKGKKPLKSKINKNDI